MNLVFITSLRASMGLSTFSIASATVRAKIVRIICSPQPDVDTPTESVDFLAQTPQPHTPA